MTLARQLFLFCSVSMDYTGRVTVVVSFTCPGSSMADSATVADIPPHATSRSATDLWLNALACWYLTGLIAALGFSLGFDFLRSAPGTPSERDVLDALTWMDGKWYKQIAVEGYQYDPNARSNVAFFPVYPLLGRAVMMATGLPAEAALLIVSNLSFFGALVLLAFYVRARYPDATEDLTGYALLAAALFPTGCFFRFAYTESTFLLLSVLAMYAMLRRWPLWSIASVVGLATAARPVGVALLLPFAIHMFRDRRSSSLHARVAPLFFGRLALYLTIACWGLGSFLAFQYCAFGEPLASFKVQGHWSARPFLPLPERLASLATLEPTRAVYDANSNAFWAAADRHGIPLFSLQFANPLFFVTAAVVIACGAWWRRLSPEEVALGALLLLIPYLTRAYEMGMGSMGRFTAVVFPIYLVIARMLILLPSAPRSALLAVSAVFMAVYAALYAAGHVIF